MKPPIQLETFRLEPDTWRAFIFRISLPRLGRLVGVLVLLTLAGTLYDPRFGIPIFVGVVVAGLSLVAILWSNCNTVIKSPLNRFVWSSRQVEFDEVGIRVATSEGARSDLPWRVIVKATDYKDYILLYISAGQTIALPKTAFREPQHLADFMGILTSHNLIKQKPAKK